MGHLGTLLNERGMEIMEEKYPHYKEWITAFFRPKIKNAGERGIHGSGESSVWEYAVKEVSVDTVAEGFKNVMDRYKSVGITTFASRRNTQIESQAHLQLARQGEHPVRFEMLVEHWRGIPMDQDEAANLFSRVPPMWDKGPSDESPFLWIGGVASERWDSMFPAGCLGPDVDAPPEIRERELCRDPTGDSTPSRVFRNATANGWRLAGIHAVGSHGLRTFVQLLNHVIDETETLDKEQVRDTRPHMAHGDVVGTPSTTVGDLYEKVKDLNIYVPLNFTHMEDAKYWVRDYGDEIEPMILPAKSLLEAGVNVTGEGEIFVPGPPNDYYDQLISTAVTREDPDGEVFAEDEAVDRVTSLKMFTILAAEALYSERMVGSLEPGKFADFQVIDRDVLDTEKVPKEELSEVKVLSTVIGGDTSELGG